MERTRCDVAERYISQNGVAAEAAPSLSSFETLGLLKFDR
jgi:hypothetical protein